MFVEFSMKVNPKKYLLEEKGFVNTTAIFIIFYLILGVQNWRVASPLRQAPFPGKGI